MGSKFIKNDSFTNDLILKIRGGKAGMEQSLASSSSNGLFTSRPVLRTLLVFCTFLYGSSYVSTKYMQERVNAVIVTTLRFLAGLISFLPVFLRFDARKDVVLGGIEIGFWYAVGFLTQGIALQTSSAAKASFVCALGVLVPPILDTVFPEASAGKGGKGENIERTRILRRFAPATLSCLGAAILEFGNVLDPPQIQDALLFLPPVAYSVAFWRCEKIARKLGPRHQPEVMTFYIMLCSFLLSAAYGLHCGALPVTRAAWRELRDVYLSKDMAFFMLYEGCLATALVAAVEQHVLKLLSAAEVTLIYSLEPVFATLTSFAFGADHLQPPLYVAGSLIVSACLLDSLWA